MSQITKSRSRRRTVEEWTQLMMAYEESGLDQRQFCQQHGLGYSTFGKWKKRLSAATHRPESDLIELMPTETETETSLLWEVELTLGSGMVLRVRRR